MSTVHVETTESIDADPKKVVEPSSIPAPTRTGACPYCLRNHLLKARGYAKEVREDPTREWEAEMLLQNLLLAEDHAEAMGDWNLRSAIRAERLRAENGEFVDAESLLARAREKILEAQRGGVANRGGNGSPVVENKAEGARASGTPDPADKTGE